MTVVDPPDTRSRSDEALPHGAGLMRFLGQMFAATRYVIVAAIICTLVGAITLSAAGALVTLDAVLDFVRERGTDPESLTHLLVRFIEVVDLILVAVVMYIISIGFYTLFIDPNLPVPPWLAPRDIDDLKVRLVGVVNAALGVLFLGRVVAWDGSSDLLTYGVATAAVIVALTYFMSAHAAKERESH